MVYWYLNFDNSETWHEAGGGYFSETPIDIFGGCSICVDQFMSGNIFENVCSDLKFTSNTLTPSKINYLEFDG